MSREGTSRVELESCYAAEDGGAHDEAFGCDGCDRSVCGMCAAPSINGKWFCPDCDKEQQHG